MALICRFEDIVAWQKGRELTRGVYRVTRIGGFHRDWALREQIRRAAVSMTSNIAEAFERGGNKEFIQFLSNAKGSCSEVRSQLYVALDQSYISEVEFQQLYAQCVQVNRLLDGFMRYLQKSNLKGRKFANQSKSTPNLQSPNIGPPAPNIE